MSVRIRNSVMVRICKARIKCHRVPEAIEGIRERTEHLDIFLFFRTSLNGVLFMMFCLLVEGECQISLS